MTAPVQAPPEVEPDTERQRTDGNTDHLCCPDCYPLPWNRLDYVMTLCGLLVDPDEAAAAEVSAAQDPCGDCVDEARIHGLQHLAWQLRGRP